MNEKIDTGITKIESVAEYQKIRKYVIDQVLLAGRERKRLASIRELAALFGVSIATIQWALRELVDDGYITAQKGVGLFTNPEKAWLNEPTDVIGVLAADGRQIYFERYLWELSAEVGREITRESRLLYNINLFYAKEKNTVNFEFSQMGGVVWIDPDFAPSDVAESFFKSLEVPVVTMICRRPGCSYIAFDEEEEGYRVGRRLLEEGRKNPVVVTKSAEMPQLAGLRRAFAEDGLRLNEKMLLYRHENTPDKLRDILGLLGTPEAIYAISGMLRDIAPVLDEANLDYSRCRLIGTELLWKPQYAGWRINRDFSQLAKVAVEQLFQEIDGAPRRDHIFVPEIETVNL